jgi:hypothetical protein
MRFSALFPMALAIVAFVLSMLCLFAGHKPGFMEDYHIITLNTSTLGYNLIPSGTSNDDPTPTSDSIGSFFSNLVEDTKDELVDTLNEIGNSVADRLADELGIHEWYSLHLMDMCYGAYKPNTTAPGASKNVSRCTETTAMYHFDITEQLEYELDLGPFDISLSDLNWPDEIQDGLDALNAATNATFILYCLGIAAAGLAIIASLVAVFLHGSRLVSIGNWGLAIASFLALLIASIIVTIIQMKASDIINEYGNAIGVYAYRGQKYLIITWVSVAAMFVAVVAWTVEFCVGKRRNRKEFTEKTSRRRGGFGAWRNRKSDEHALRRSGV